MTKTSTVFARVQPEVKQEAEEVLGKLGISMSNAIDMFLRQIAIQKGIPFEMKLPRDFGILDPNTMSEEEFEAELEKGWESIQKGRVYREEEVDAYLKKKFGK